MFLKGGSLCRSVGVLRVVKSVLGVVKSVMLRYGRSGLRLSEKTNVRDSKSRNLIICSCLEVAERTPTRVWVRGMRQLVPFHSYYPHHINWKKKLAVQAGQFTRL